MKLNLTARIFIVVGALSAAILMVYVLNQLKDRHPSSAVPSPTAAADTGVKITSTGRTYGSIRHDLDWATKGDFVLFDGEWCVVTGKGLASAKSKDNVIMLRSSYALLSVPVYYNYDTVIVKVQRVVVWDDPYRDPGLTHALWTVAAREYFTR